MLRLLFRVSPILFLVISSASAYAQGSLSGAVFDELGDSVPAARVMLVHHQNGRAPDDQRLLFTNSEGKFAEQGIAAGSYTVVVTSTLADYYTEKIVITDGQNLDLPIHLKTAIRSATNVYRAPSDQIIHNGRTYLDLVRDRAAITPGQQGGDIEGYGPYGFRGNLSLNAFGQRGQYNNFLLDGLDNNDSWVRGSIMIPPIESIGSVNIFTGYIPAEFGHAAGAVVVVESRHASNRLHGSVFEDFRNSVLNTPNFFDGAHKPASEWNRFGGTLAGPIRKDNWFLSGTVEILRSKEGLTVLSTVPTADQKSGNFSAGNFTIYDPRTITSVGENVFARLPFANNQVPMQRVPLAIQKLLALYPNPNLPGSADNFRFTPSGFHNREYFDIRSDKTVSRRSTVFLRLSYQRDHDQSPGTFPVPAGIVFPSSTLGSDATQHADNEHRDSNAWSGVVSNTFTLRPSLVSLFRFGMSGSNFHARANDAGLNASAFLGIPGLGNDGLPSINATGFTSLGSSAAAPFDLRSTNAQVEENIEWRTAHHVFKFGVQGIRRHLDGNASDVTSRGEFNFTPDYTSQPGSASATGDSFASLILGFPSEVRRDVQFQPYQLRAWEWSGYAQDQIRLFKRFTIHAGLRYSLLPPVTEANNRMVNFNFSSTAPALDQFAGVAGVNRYGGLGYSKRAIAPRIGFVLDVSRDGSTVLRGSFSKAYDTGSYLAIGRLARNPPYASLLDMINGTFQLGPNLSTGLTAPSAISLLNAAALNSVHGVINSVQPENFTPYADQWDLFLQHRLRPRLALEIGGMGSMGIHLDAAFDENQPYPAPTPYATPRYPFDPYESRINYLNLGGGSTYYGGQIKLSGQVLANLNVSMSYAFAKSEDDAMAPNTTSESRPTDPQFIYSARGNRSPSPFDVTQRAVLSAHYDVPAYKHTSRIGRTVLMNWSVSTLITIQTGFPFTPELATNSLNNGGYQLPNRVGNGSLPSGHRSYLQWFDTRLGAADSAFRVPALYQYGNSGLGILRGPGLATVDASLGRVFKLRESLRLQARAEAFNLLNHANFALPNRILGVESSGVISHTITPARQIQLVLALVW